LLPIVEKAALKKVKKKKKKETAAKVRDENVERKIDRRKREREREREREPTPPLSCLGRELPRRMVFSRSFNNQSKKNQWSVIIVP
jgi:hypothetical protein